MSLVTGALAVALTAAPLLAFGPSGGGAVAAPPSVVSAPAAPTPIVPAPSATAGDPLSVSGLAAKAAGATSAAISWSPPTDPAAAAVTVTRTDPTGVARTVYSGTATSAPDTGLVPGLQYSYTAVAEDASGRRGPVSRNVLFTPNRTWTTTAASPYAGWPGAVDCATTTWCMVVNNTGTFQVMSGSTWSAPVSAFGASSNPDRAGSVVTSLTCPSAGRCLAIRSNMIVEFSGGTWRSAGAPSSGWRAVDCPTTTYCVAIRGDGWSTTRVGTTWTPPVRIGTLRGVEWWDVGCQAAGRCFAVATGNSTYSSWRATLTSTWSTAYLGSYQQGNAYRISCSSTTCLGLGDRVRVTVSGTTWALQTLGPHNTDDWANELSCGSPSLCVALNYGNVARWSSTALLERTRLSAGIGTMAGVSCPRTGGACFAIDNRGRLYRWTPTTRWVLATTLQTTGGVGRPGCLSTTSCFLFDGNGWLVSWNGATWTRSGKLFTQRATVECSGPGFCIAVDRASKAYRVWAEGAWGAAKTMPLAAADISCASPTLCLAVDADGRASRFNGVGWWAPVAALKDPYADGPSVSCAPGGPCMLASSEGTYRRYVGTAFTTTARLPSGLPAEDRMLSCATASSCVLAVQSGSWAQWNGSAWTVHLIDSSVNRFGTLTCLTSSHCLATHPYSNDTVPMVWNSGTWSDDGTYAPDEVPYAPECPTIATCFVAGGTTVSRSS
ncbi:hypothetical protein [Terrabacter sp. 2RAF25]|uniref:hypothetical protein n=1 Tax=Terrabacter sp. 2RAF25 TaxID=3232998 RepID=UPI003F97D02F